MKKLRLYKAWEGVVHPNFKKITRIMRIVVLLMLTSFIGLSANSFSQNTRWSMDIEEKTINEVFLQLEGQTGYRFAYNKDVLDDTKLVSVKVNNETLENILKQVLDLQTHSYSIIDKYILITTKKPGDALQEGKEIKGKVVDQEGQPLPGVSVFVKGTTIGITTDFDGNYTLQVPAGAESISFSFVGMTTQEIEIGNQTKINVTLSASAIGLEEVVAVGYGTMKKSDLTGAVSNFSLEEVGDRPVKNVAEALQGNVAGVTVVSNGGDPTSKPSVRIRGIGTLSNEEPLWIVDGSITSVPVNPEDIETITVLKDAASAAIYGARAAAGVIMVTTKKGVKGKPVIKLNSYYGIQQASNLYNPLNQAQMADVYNLAADNAGVDRPDVFNPSLNPDARTTRTDWIDEIFRSGVIQKHTVSVSGAGDYSSFYISGSYQKTEGVLLNTFQDDYNFRINSEHKISDKITFGQNLSLGSGNGQSATTDDEYAGAIFSALAYPASAKVYTDETQTTFSGVTDPGSPWTGSYGDLINPVALLKRLDNKTDNIIVGGNAFIEYEIIEGLKFKSNLSLNYEKATNKQFSSRQLEPGKIFDENSLRYVSYTNFSWVTEQTLTYNTMIGEDHNLTAMVGYTAQENEYKGFTAAARQFPIEDAYARYFDNATLFDIKPTDYKRENSLISFLGRVNYAYKNKYLLTANVRRDGTSKLTSNNRWGVYPALSAAWRMSEESFLNDHPAISNLKLRGSWGKIGNLGALSDYATNVNLSKVYAFLGENPDWQNGLVQDGISNPDLKWEVTNQTNLGLDLSLYNGKFNIVADYFYKETEDMLMRKLLSSLAGVNNAPWVNVGAVKNQGFEFSFTYSEREKPLKYDITASISRIKNEVTSLGEETFINHGDGIRGVLMPLRTQVGSPLYSFYVYKNDGIFQSDAEVQAHKNSNGELLQPLAKPGDLRFSDLNGDGTLNDEDRYIAGDAWPDFTFGLNASLNYRDWDFSMFVQGATGVKLFNGLKYSMYRPSLGYNMVDEVLNAWSPSNTGSDIPIVSLKDENNNFGTTSDWYLENGSYMRIKNVTLGYTVPQEKIKPLGIGDLRLYISAQNLLTLSGYTGMDPEIGNRGIDKGKYPVARTLIMGINVSF
ncbi:SusC/RagA family TonB-linked outer membrane protein [Puteibacter caeruleilacunae]|nr:SusC/RagA family TonB-linked outer membrane protein [Puteibacter caeruleilacunae]